MAPTHDDPDQPGPRALGAMSADANRAAGGGDDGPNGEGPKVSPEMVRAYEAARRIQAKRRNERILRALAVVLGMAVVLAAVTLGVIEIGHHIHTSSPGASASGSSSGSSSSSTTSSSLPAVVPGGPPVVMSLSPSSGAAGQTVVITGANFVSADGHVAASFGGVVASTQCSSATSCTATAPPAPAGGGQVPVTVTTATGTSNPVNFTYQ